jgi:hypothetical protein
LAFFILNNLIHNLFSNQLPSWMTICVRFGHSNGNIGSGIKCPKDGGGPEVLGPSQKISEQDEEKFPY